MANVVPRLWTNVAYVPGALTVMPRPGGLDTGQLIVYLSLVVLTGVGREGGLHALSWNSRKASDLLHKQYEGTRMHIQRFFVPSHQTEVSLS